MCLPECISDWNRDCSSQPCVGCSERIKSTTRNWSIYDYRLVLCIKIQSTTKKTVYVEGRNRREKRPNLSDRFSFVRVSIKKLDWKRNRHCTRPTRKCKWWLLVCLAPGSLLLRCNCQGLSASRHQPHSNILLKRMFIVYSIEIYLLSLLLWWTETERRFIAAERNALLLCWYAMVLHNQKWPKIRSGCK